MTLAYIPRPVLDQCIFIHELEQILRFFCGFFFLNKRRLLIQLFGNRQTITIKSRTQIQYGCVFLHIIFFFLKKF